MSKSGTAKCPIPHTKVQMDIKTWCCPKCGATPDTQPEFYMYEMQEGADEQCDLTHPEDELYCMACDWSGTGAKWSRLMAKKQKDRLCTILVPYKYFEQVRAASKTDKQATTFLQALVTRLLEKEFEPTKKGGKSDGT